jgi:symplekin
MDPLQALTAALSVPTDSKEQADLLAALRETMEAHPHPIPILCNTLLKTAAGSNDSLLKRWVLELLHFGIARAPLSVEARTNRTFLLHLFLSFFLSLVGWLVGFMC